MMLWLETKVQKGETIGLSWNCSSVELSVSSLKSKATADDFPSKKVKRPKQAEANFYPSLPIGESTESLEKELLTQIQIRNNERVIADKMTRLPIEDRRW